MFIGKPVYEGFIEEINCWCYWESSRYISGMICITIRMGEVGLFLIFVDFCIPCFEETLMWYFICFEIFISWLNDRFIGMLHDIFHAMYDRKEFMFYWGIHVSTDIHCKILKIIESLINDMNEATIPVIEVSSMWFLICFDCSTIIGVYLKSIFSKDVSTVKGGLWNFT